MRAGRQYEQPGTVASRDSGRGQRQVQRGQRFGGPPSLHPALGQSPVQVHQKIGVGGMLQRVVRYLLGPRRVTGAVEGVGESAREPAVPRRARRTGHGPGQEFGGNPWCLADQQVRSPSQPVEHPVIGRRSRATESVVGPQQLPGHPVRRCAGLSQGAAGSAVPGRAYRRRHVVIQCGPDQRMPEPQAVAGSGQHAHGTRLVHRRDQVGNAAAQHGGQIGDREVRAEQGRRPQDLADRTGDEAEAVRYRRGKGARCGTAGPDGRLPPR